MIDFIIFVSVFFTNKSSCLRIQFVFYITLIVIVIVKGKPFLSHYECIEEI